METRLSAAIILFLGLGFLALSAVAPKPVVAEPHTRSLAALEQRIADVPTDIAGASQLAGAYLELRRPELAIALVRSMGAAAMADPLLSHQLARAYEASHRVPDALATAALALARCARTLGSSDVLHVTDVPRHPCSERTLAALERHHTALTHMQQWGVQAADDHRVALAYRIAERRVSLASYTTP
jgi:hypothetical protein